MRKLKNYLLGIFGGGLLFTKVFLTEDRVILNVIKEVEPKIFYANKTGLNAEKAAISEIKIIKSPIPIIKEKIFFSKKKIGDFLEFIVDPDYFNNTSVQILSEVLDESHKESLTSDFEEWYDDDKYDWERIKKTIKTDLNEKKILNERFRHMILFQYSNTYFETYCIKYLQSGKAIYLKSIKLKAIALKRGFTENSYLLKSINNFVKINK
jgi:hypothetical protein